MTPAAREQARHKASVMIAYADGRTIRCREVGTSNPWYDITDPEEVPAWDWEEYEYEVKPEERKPREIWVVEDRIYEVQQMRGDGMTPIEGQTHFREVLPETETES